MVWLKFGTTCVLALEGPRQSICAISFYPQLGIALTGSEEGTVAIWNCGRYDLQTSLNYGYAPV